MKQVVTNCDVEWKGAEIRENKASDYRWNALKFEKGGNNYRWEVLTSAEMNVHLAMCLWHGRRIMLLLRSVVEGVFKHTLFNMKIQFSQSPNERTD